MLIERSGLVALSVQSVVYASTHLNLPISQRWLMILGATHLLSQQQPNYKAGRLCTWRSATTALWSSREGMLNSPPRRSPPPPSAAIDDALLRSRTHFRFETCHPDALIPCRVRQGQIALSWWHSQLWDSFWKYVRGSEGMRMGVRERGGKKHIPSFFFL